MDSELTKILIRLLVSNTPELHKLCQTHNIVIHANGVSFSEKMNHDELLEHVKLIKDVSLYPLPPDPSQEKNTHEKYDDWILV